MRHAVFLSTLSLRRATNARPDIRQPCAISIHALLAESDPLKNAITAVPQQISIHALLAESDTSVLPTIPAPAISIHALLAESDKPPLIVSANPPYFYPRSPCGERPTFIIYSIIDKYISIHALLAESDLELFLYYQDNTISIHALLAESDPTAENGSTRSNNFYPRSPCGERPQAL